MAFPLQQRMPAFALLCAAVAFTAFALTDIEKNSIFLLIAAGNFVSGIALWLSKGKATQTEASERDGQA